MGSFYSSLHKPPRTGDSPYTRTGEPPPKLRRQAKHHFLGDQDKMSLEMHMRDERQRTRGLTAEERDWRRKWVLDQKLHPDEPVRVEAVYRQLNPIRRVYRWPLDKLFERVLAPRFVSAESTFVAQNSRALIPKWGIAFFILCFSWYYLKYEHQDWLRVFGGRNRPFLPMLTRYHQIEAECPGAVAKAFGGEMPMTTFYDQGFSTRTAYLGPKLGPTARPW